ncbi:hypothetical protein [Rhizobium sp. Root1220]|uniref:hypothetical protein n=1 Tax=Rhizobium sp. Root1220 TaxID=1736432 RepID=UPI0006F7783D|nr:hypothetical protein [Rhizobium sp. Root1220]KQV78182.1 hypothetical protein ASC90_27030 [Rhizobium sp. Root1220]
MYQFIHLHAYARQEKDGRSVEFILGEADRGPRFSSHIENPLPPEVIFGLPLSAVREQHDLAVNSARQATRSGIERRIRTTQKTLLTVIASHPIKSEEARTDAAHAREVENWEQRTIEWLSLKFDSQLLSVIRHADEPYRHLHAFVLPASHDVRALELHPGYRAKALAMRSRDAWSKEERAALNREGDRAFRKEMREWQDDYHTRVGAPCGLTRIGPAKRRLSREAWKLEGKSAQALKTTIDQATDVRSNTERWLQAKTREAQAILASAAEEASRILSEADALLAKAESREADARTFELSSRRAWAGARNELRRLSTVARQVAELEESKSIIARLESIDQAVTNRIGP